MKALPEKTIAGIDYGKKMNGTTVLCTLKGNEVSFRASPIKQDADEFLLSQLHGLNPDSIFIDVPLSIPGVYWLNSNFDNYFFREADQAVRAMSPMFLGGLTARGIRIKDMLLRNGFQCYEVYPSRLAYEFGLSELGYKDKKADIAQVVQKLKPYLPLNIFEEALTSWHHVDALLASISGLRYHHNAHSAFGNEREGLIIV